MPDSANHSHLPSIDRILRELGEGALPRPMTLNVARRVLADLRAGGDGHHSPHETIEWVRAAAASLGRRRIQSVINATGIIIHTNLGRSPMGRRVARALIDVATQYNTLEYDLESGERGSRGAYLETALAVLCEAQAATAVNNCAAALVLILRHFTSKPPRNEVILSRGELVEIGGGFRIPEILQASGAVLREVGTTNITTPHDYRQAIGDKTALILKVHQSNFFTGGFVESPSTADIATIAREAGVPFVEDVGSGAIFDTRTLGGNEYEPMPAKALADGADVVCFSGDKLFGGPQAGIIAGGKEHIAALKAEPFFRALRCDKLVLAALQATVDCILAGQVADIPIRAMMSATVDDLHHRAEKAVARLQAAGVDAAIVPTHSQVGGGSLPRTTLESIAIELAPPREMSANNLAAALRRTKPPIIACVWQDRVRMDLRTILPRQEAKWLAGVAAACEVE